MKIGQAKIDFDALKIKGPAGEFSVEPKVMAVLSVLIDNAGEVVSREDLIDQVWGVGYGGDERLSRAISLLRKSLGDTRGEHAYIQTIPTRGYKLTVEIDPAASKAPVSSVTGGEPESVVENSRLQTSTKTTYWSRIMAAILAVLLALSVLFYFQKKSVVPGLSASPLVIIMDSAHPARIYDEAVISEGGTNADILSDILADLPVKTQKELISPSWHRYEAITQFDPDLIVIHYSGFKQEDASGDRPQLRLLIEYFLKSDTKFLVYTRADEEWLDGSMNNVLEDLYVQNPSLKERINLFPLLEYGQPHWKDQESAQGIKLKIKEILDLE